MPELPPNFPPELQRRITDAVEMVGRTGARSFQLGYLVDDPPPGVANWYAEAEYRTGTLVTDSCMTPWEAAEALADATRAGARCRWCGRPISWGDRPSGKRRRKLCWWRKVAGRWERGCPRTSTPAVPHGYRP